MTRDDGTMFDVADALRKLQTFTADMDETAFRADEKTQAAVLHEFMVLGEAVKRLSEPFRESHPDIPWRRIAGFRDRLIHDYDQVDLRMVWTILCNDLPTLKQQLGPLAKPAAPEGREGGKGDR